MKKTMKTMLAFVAGSLCLAGCEKVKMIEETNNARLVTLTAYQEGEDGTKAAIDSEINTRINWSEGDRINYFGGAAGQSMTLRTGAGTPSGTFSGTVTAGTADYVLYPYQETATCTAEGIITAEVPMTQYAVANSFDPKAALMAGEVQNGSVQFKNVMSYVKVTIPSTMTRCKQVAIKAKGAWTTVAGKINIIAETGAWEETSGKEGQAFVRLVPQNGDTYLTANTSYYIAILPQTMTTGFELIFNDDDVIKVKQASTSVEFGRSKTKKLGAITSFNYTVSAFQVTSTLKVADRNIGAASSADCGDYFAWAALRPAYVTKKLNLIGDRLKDLYKDGGYNAANTPYNSGSSYTKYNSTNGKTVLEKEDDIAAMLWGGNWRMPTKDEFAAIYNATTWTWNNNDNGYYVKAKDETLSDILFFPAAGYVNNSKPSRISDIFYWSKSLKTTNNAYNLESFTMPEGIKAAEDLSSSADKFRYYGITVRPVSE